VNWVGKPKESLLVQLLYPLARESERLADNSKALWPLIRQSVVSDDDVSQTWREPLNQTIELLRHLSLQDLRFHIAGDVGRRLTEQLPGPSSRFLYCTL
jgi:hypothetical protein